MTHLELVPPVYGGYLRSCAYNLFKGDMDILGFWAWGFRLRISQNRDTLSRKCRAIQGP